MIKRIALYVTLSVMLFTSCRKENPIIDVKQDRAVLFSSKIAGQVQTRVSGSQWDENDAISIYMYAGSGLSASTILEEGFNKEFITSRSGNFRPKSTADEIRFPEGKAVQFVSFYPYQAGRELNRQLDIANQEEQSKIDYLYGKSAAANGATQGPVHLLFERIISKIRVKLQGENLEGLTAQLSNLETEADFDLTTATLNKKSTKKSVSGKVVQVGAEKYLELVIYPGKLDAMTKMIFRNVAGDSFTWDIAGLTTEYAAGNMYQYEVQLGKDGGVTPKPNVSYFELPIISNSMDLQYSFKMTPDQSKRNFAMLYDQKNKLALWVAYPLSRDYVGGQSRTNAWGYDPDINRNFQPLLSKGFGIGGIDRGHQLPSADRTKNRAENATTFYYSNMTAQEATLNQGVWAKLENQVRTWMQRSGVDTMYVVTGAGLQVTKDQPITYVRDNAGQEVAKPKYYYKALAVKRGTAYYTIGFKFDNVNTSGSAQPNSYRVTVRELEQLTGYTFFPALSTAEKSTINNAIWN
ncbi:DNA/RNA non-specific endonuclease [Sphingobacterium lactis]|uniref:Endonuclease G n=1 Tax=Sphingobacterium lactis TaxID=797291 RepID=A0A1H5WUD2_9SPHI|nr:DNA/RNA non-specific endonuclease [Sphingobacterium lactis]SEG03159.1 endonuclease G [Sphingobacterium lactis]